MNSKSPRTLIKGASNLLPDGASLTSKLSSASENNESTETKAAIRGFIRTTVEDDTNSTITKQNNSHANNVDRNQEISINDSNLELTSVNNGAAVSSQNTDDARHLKNGVTKTHPPKEQPKNILSSKITKKRIDSSIDNFELYLIVLNILLFVGIVITIIATITLFYALDTSGTSSKILGRVIALKQSIWTELIRPLRIIRWYFNSIMFQLKRSSMFKEFHVMIDDLKLTMRLVFPASKRKK